MHGFCSFWAPDNVSVITHVHDINLTFETWHLQIDRLTLFVILLSLESILDLMHLNSFLYNASHVIFRISFCMRECHRVQTYLMF